MKRFLALSFFLHAVVVGGLILSARASLERLAGRPGAPGVLWLHASGWGDVGHAAQPNHSLPGLRSASVAPKSLKDSVPSSSEEGSEAAAAGTGVNASGAGTGGGGEGGAGGTSSDPRLLAIRRKLEAAKRYPSLALRQGIEGTTRVRFRIDERGIPIETQILESSGSDLLDQATLQTIRQASPLPVVSGWLTFPLRYDLRAARDS